MTTTSLLKRVKNARDKARLERNSIKCNILSVVLGEYDRLLYNQKSESRLLSIIKKLIVSNKEVLAKREDNQLELENGYLEEFVPKTMSKEKIRTVLEGANLQKYGNVGKAIGIAVKLVPEADGKVVAEVVRELNRRWVN